MLSTVVLLVSVSADAVLPAHGTIGLAALVTSLTSLVNGLAALVIGLTSLVTGLASLVNGTCLV